MHDRPQPVLEHLAELRIRILLSLGALVLAIAAAAVFTHRVFMHILSTARVSGAVALVQTSFGETFLAEFRLAILLGLLLAFPFLVYQAVAFVLPALTPKERRLLYVGLPAATLLFIGGWAFGWYVVVPITRGFFLQVANRAGIESLITPGAYLSFVMGICSPLGILFELPLVALILTRLGVVTARFLARVRKYAFFGLLLLAALLSPPDVISMAIFLLPLYGLYELSILVAKLAAPKPPK